MKIKIYSILFCFACGFAFSQSAQVRQIMTRGTSLQTQNELIEQFNWQKKQDEQSKAFILKDTLEVLVPKDPVYSLERINPDGVYIYYSVNNSKAAEFSRVHYLQRGLLELKGEKLLGQNMFVGLLDADVVLDSHKEFGWDGTNTRALVMDKAKESSLVFDLGSSQSIDRRNHATHVGGTLIAGGYKSNALGILPYGQLYSYNWDKDILKMVSLASNGVWLSNHSYGIATISKDNIALIPAHYFGVYSREAKNFDTVMREFPYYQAVVAAGNDRKNYAILNPSKKGKDLLVGYALAKNAIVVGAILGERLTSKGVKFLETNFSSYGPTADFRVKPDIVANGVGVYSSIYSSLDGPENASYGLKSGTSMATPVVSGILTLWQQWVIENRKIPYKASSIKAIMIHSAEPLETSLGPSYRYGWGLVNAYSGLLLLKNSLEQKSLILQEAIYDNQGFSASVFLKEDSPSVSFTLVWNDLAAQDKIQLNLDGQTPDLINDLDMRIIGPDGQEHFPWVLNKDYNNLVAIQGDNDVDNVEKIDIFDALKGEYIINIRPKGNFINNWQDFSLVASDQNFGGLSLVPRQQKQEDLTFQVWPNPAPDKLHLLIPEQIVFDKNELEVYNIKGQLVYSKVIFKVDHYELNVAHFEPGLYFLKLKGSLKDYQAKFIKK
ncbi:S8 family serine peptidase [Myroides sp. LJL115]